MSSTSKRFFLAAFHTPVNPVESLRNRRIFSPNRAGLTLDTSPQQTNGTRQKRNFRQSSLPLAGKPTKGRPILLVLSAYSQPRTKGVPLPYNSAHVVRSKKPLRSAASRTCAPAVSIAPIRGAHRNRSVVVLSLAERVPSGIAPARETQRPVSAFEK